MTTKDFYEHYWEGESAAPDSDPTVRERERKLTAALLDVPRGSRVMDLGCGRGGFTRLIAKLGYKAVGCDMAEAAIESARSLAPELEFRALGEAGKIPEPDGTVSAVWSSEVIEHVFDVGRHLAEVNRVLVPGGRLILTTPFHGRVKDVIIALWKFDKHFDPEVSHIRFFDKRALTRCLARAGFQVRLWDGVGRYWPIYRSWFVVAEKVRAAEPARQCHG